MASGLVSLQATPEAHSKARPFPVSRLNVVESRCLSCL